MSCSLADSLTDAVERLFSLMAKFCAVFNIGAVLAVLGASLAVGLACIGSAKGTGLVGEAGAGLLTEDSSKFGGILLLQVLPGTQGLYGFVVWAITFFLKLDFTTIFLPVEQGGLTLATGAAIGMACLPIGIAGLLSAIAQGRVAAAGVSVLAKKPEAQGNAVVMCIIVEFYAILSLLASLFMILQINTGA